MEFDELRAELGLDPDSPVARDVRALSEEAERLLDALVAMRKQHKLTQRQVAEKLGLSQSAVSKFEKGERDPRLSTLRRYAAAVGALVGYSVTESDRFRDIDSQGIDAGALSPQYVYIAGSVLHSTITGAAKCNLSSGVSFTSIYGSPKVDIFLSNATKAAPVHFDVVDWDRELEALSE